MKHLAILLLLVLCACSTAQNGSTVPNDLLNDYKINVRAATTASITIATALNAGDTLDGLTLAAGNRVLVKNQGTASQNGIYVVGASPARASDANAWTELPGSFVVVQAGTANKGKTFVCTAAETGTVGSTDITYSEKGATGAGTGDLLAANNLDDLANAGTARTNLGLGTMSTQDSGAVSITGGSLDGVSITGSTLDGEVQATTTFNDAPATRDALGFNGSSMNLGGGVAALELRFLEPSGSGSNYFGLKAAAMAGNVALTWPNDAPAAGEVLGDSDGNGVLEWLTPAGSGDVTASAGFGTDNVIIRSDGTGKGVQATGWSIADTTDDITGPGNITTTDDITAEGYLITGKANDTTGNIKFLNSGNAFQGTLRGIVTADRAWDLPDADGNVALEEWVTAGFGALGTANTWTAANVFNLYPRVPNSDLAAGTALTLGTAYHDDLSANRTLTFSGTPAEGTTVSVTFTVTNNPTLTFPSCKRAGAPDSATTSLRVPNGVHTFTWIHKDAQYVLYDSVGTTTLAKEWSFDPKAVCDGAVDRLFLFKVGAWAPNGIRVTGWRVSFEADPTTEVDLDLKRADAFIGVANSAVMDVLDTTAGASSEATEANINSGAVVANGKVLYLEFGTAYSETTHQIIFEMEYEVQ